VTDLNTNLFKFDTCNDFLHCSNAVRGNLVLQGLKQNIIDIDHFVQANAVIIP
jgi:hypothetical protein